MINEKVKAIMEALAAPFDASEIKWKPQATTKDGQKAMAVPFVDATAVKDRLDDVLGIDGWQDEFEFHPGGVVLCKLSVRIEGEWVTKADVGGESEQPDGGDRCKAAVSDALKRAAVKYGVGRYLKNQTPQWVPYDSQKRKFLETPRMPTHPSQKVGNSPPDRQRQQASPAPQAQPQQPQSAPRKPSVKSVGDVVDYFDQRLLADGVIDAPGQLAGHIMDTFKGKHKGPISSWPIEAYEEVKAACIAFANERASRMAEVGQ